MVTIAEECRLMPAMCFAPRHLLMARFCFNSVPLWLRLDVCAECLTLFISGTIGIFFAKDLSLWG